MSTPLRYQGTPVTDTRQEVDAHPTPAPRPPGRPGSGHGIISLCLAAASFVTAPFLLLIPAAGFIPAGPIVSVMLFGLTLSIAMLWTRLVVAPAVSDYSELQEVIDHIKRMIFGS